MDETNKEKEKPPGSYELRGAYWKDVTRAEWDDWHWQMKNLVKNVDQLRQIIHLTPDEEEACRRKLDLKLGITPHFAALMERDDPYGPIRLQVVPNLAEFALDDPDLNDPLGEDAHMPVPGLVHRYPDRVLIDITDQCVSYCRHCTRRRLTLGEAAGIDRAALDEAIAYVRAHPSIRDVIVSGGDPLVLSDERLDEILSALRAVPHVQLLRVATRAPVVNPMRVDAALARLLRRHAPLFVVTHFNHPKECTPDARAACETLVDHGVPVENQTVLLRGVNSSPRILRDLFERLLTFRVRPYYLHQGDLAEGTAHLRTPLEAGIAILEALRGTTSGLAIPHLAVDLPGGGGKVTLTGRRVVSTDGKTMTVTAKGTSAKGEPVDLAMVFDKR